MGKPEGSTSGSLRFSTETDPPDVADPRVVILFPSVKVLQIYLSHK